ncbi:MULTISPECIES: PAS domain-containing protein [unclassified Novosphingobium]|uniref:PAS domain-containing protein n=1 Tax=unclassified Novosphingobium TaxID=2644732 RepID=UPI00086EFF34|nr:MULTISPECIES: PAS domain-containing protein [unclassified Novosphingobium]MBN9143407.1 PAS domain-containing protein [Novosphingobium sp.]ODU83804.1 MAG: histidine kinase [Novosphingobium sp. SCN 63-17]OJX92612.1 MAG: histidine kinase [Novosphingobium sp. 63-713]
MLPDEMIKHSPIAAVVSDPRLPDNPIIACNQAFIDLTGFAREEIIGRNCRFLRGPDTEGELTETLRNAIHNRQPAIVEIRNYKKDGTPFRNAVMIAPVFDADGEVEYFLGSQVEVVDQNRQTREEALARVNALPPRQRQILVEMARGKLNKQVAWELGLSERTIKMHRSAMFKTLGVRSSAEAIRVAVEAGL